MASGDDDPAQRASTDAVRLPDSNGAGAAENVTQTDNRACSMSPSTDQLPSSAATTDAASTQPAPVPTDATVSADSERAQSVDRLPDKSSSKRHRAESDPGADNLNESVRAKQKKKNQKKRAKAKATNAKDTSAISLTGASVSTVPSTLPAVTAASTPSTTSTTPSTLPAATVASTPSTTSTTATIASSSVRPRPAGKQPRPAGKQPRPAGKQPIGKHPRAVDDDEEEDATQAEERKKEAWKKKHRKRLTQRNLPDDMEQVESIIDYEIDPKTRKIGMVKVVFFDDKKTDWVHKSEMTNYDAFKGDIEALRLWKRSTIPTFKQFLTTTAGKKHTMKKRAHGADDRMACGYNAVGIALELLGLPNRVTKSSIEEFRAIGAKRRKISVEEYEKRGVVWPALSKFIEQLGLVDVDVINKNLYYGDGSGVDGLQKLDLEDGVYIIGGWSTERIGHCFVLEVTCGGTGVSVHDTEGLEDVNWLRQWLASVSFVRRVEPVKK